MSIFEPLKVAIVGCGAVSKLYYTPALKELEKQNVLRVIALFDPIHENMEQINKSFPAARQVHELAGLADLQIDLGIIASPPQYHAEQTIRLLQSGVSVLCEKPMATSSKEGEAMIQAAMEAQRILAVGLFRRFFPATHAIREVLSRHLLGDVLSFSCYEGGSFQWPVHSASYFEKHGVLMDIGVHLLDLLVWWWGQPVEVEYQDDAMGGVEVNCRIQLRFAQGFTGEVRLSREWPRPNRYVIRCTNGWLSWVVNDADRIQLGFYDSDFALNSQLVGFCHSFGDNEIEVINLSLEEPSINFQRNFIHQLQNVVAAVRGVEQPVVPGEQGLESLRLIEECYRNRTFMDMPWLSEQESARAQLLSSKSQCH